MRTLLYAKRVRGACLVVAGVLVVVSGLGLWQSVSAAGKETPRDIGYEHRGAFDYDVYVEPGILYSEEFELSEGEQGDEMEQAATIQPQETDEPPMVLFREILEDLRLAFTYSFECGEPTSGLSSDVVVSIAAEDPGLWQKELRRWQETHSAKEFRVDFPFDVDTLESAVEEIEDDIDITRSQRDFVVEATVRTHGETLDGQPIDGEFSQSLRLILDEETLELEGDLQKTTEGGSEDVSWTCTGRFDYEALLEYNPLYDATVLRSESLPVAEPEEEPQVTQEEPETLYELDSGQVYFPRVIESIEGSFSYSFDSDAPVAERTHAVEIAAVLENPDTWSKRLVLAHSAEVDGDIDVSFPIDISYYDEVVRAIDEQLGTRTGSYNIDIEAVVDTTAETEYGTVEETYTQVLKGKMQGSTLSFSEELTASKQGAIERGAAAGNEEGTGWKTPSVAGMAVGVVGLGVLGWNEMRLRAARLRHADGQAARARKKYKDTLVDVDELPATRPGDLVVPVSSVDHLAKISDESLKPLLHCVQEGAHTYCVIDGSVRYKYTVHGMEHASEP